MLPRTSSIWTRCGRRRVKNVRYQLNNEEEITLSAILYDSLGHLVQNLLHNGQDTISYSYDLRNMLTQTRNNHFSERLFYADSLPQAAHACYNGNLSAAQSTYGNFELSFAYFYDALNRLTESKQLVLNLSTTNSERFTFTGKERDAETGYDYFGARYRGPKFLDYFLSVDPLADKYIDNSPYVYCSGNPIMLVDPSGMDEEQREAGKKWLNSI